jgi:cell shape-determining protein MreD
MAESLSARFKPYALPVFSTMMAVVLNIANQKYGTFVPDWLMLLLVYVALG